VSIGEAAATICVLGALLGAGVVSMHIDEGFDV